jgi:hypothetical protein
MPPIKWHETLIRDIRSILSVGQIYHVEIPKQEIFIGSLIRTINLLPELDTIKIHSLSLDQPRELCDEEIQILSSIANTSKITKLNLEMMNDIKEMDFIMKLCPYMTHFKLNSVTFIINIRLLLQIILEKIKQEHHEHLRSLCFSVPRMSDEMFQEFTNWINSEKLLFDYTIKRVFDNLYLQWK